MGRLATKSASGLKSMRMRMGCGASFARPRIIFCSGTAEGGGSGAFTPAVSAMAPASPTSSTFSADTSCGRPSTTLARRCASAWMPPGRSS